MTNKYRAVQIASNNYNCNIKWFHGDIFIAYEIYNADRNCNVS